MGFKPQDLACAFKNLFKSSSTTAYKFDRRYCGHLGLEKAITTRALGVLFALILISSVIYGFVSKQIYYQPVDKDKPQSSIDVSGVITTVLTLLIFITAVIFHQMHYVGYLPYFGLFKAKLRHPLTEAFLQYTLMFGFAMLIIGPGTKVMKSTSNNEVDEVGLFPFTPLVFLLILFGYYLFQLIKILTNQKRFQKN